MDDPTLTFRRYDDDWNEVSLADQISGMELNTVSALYSDFRSLSRGVRHHRRKRQPILNPIYRNKHCHADCIAYEKRQISNRKRRWIEVRAECTEDAYWDKECAELEHRERTEYSDLVTLYYNHGHNAAVIESLRPLPSQHDASEPWSDASDGDQEAQEWVSVSPSSSSTSQISVITTPMWTIYLYPPLSCTPESEEMEFGSESSPPPASNDTTFTYHLNLTGLWELGYASPAYDPSSTDPLGCSQTPLMLDCGCCSFNTGFYECSCAEFGVQWRGPEEHWRGSLVECVSMKAYQRMCLKDEFHQPTQRGPDVERSGDVQTESDEAGKGVVEGSSEEWTFVCAPRVKPRDGEEWDLVSAFSSTGSWRIVDVT